MLRLFAIIKFRQAGRQTRYLQFEISFFPDIFGSSGIDVAIEFDPDRLHGKSIARIPTQYVEEQGEKAAPFADIGCTVFAGEYDRMQFKDFQPRNTVTRKFKMSVRNAIVSIEHMDVEHKGAYIKSSLSSQAKVLEPQRRAIDGKMAVENFIDGYMALSRPSRNRTSSARIGAPATRRWK